MGDDGKQTLPRSDSAPKCDAFDVIDLVGGDGPWQRRMFWILAVIAVLGAINNMVMTFLAPNTDHWCARPDDTNLTVEEWKAIGLPDRGYECYRLVDVEFIT